MSSTTPIIARFVSMWDRVTRIETGCMIDPLTGVITIEMAQDGEEECVTTLDSQHILIGEFSLPVVEGEDGVFRIENPTQTLPVLQEFSPVFEDLPDYVYFGSFLKHGTNPKANTKIDYTYRDGANYKTDASLIFPGVITAEQIKMIRENLMPDGDEDNFLPRQVGLKPLCPWTDDDEYEDDIDHCIHTLVGITLVLDDAQEDDPIVDLANKFAAIGPQGWDMVKFGNEPHWC